MAGENETAVTSNGSGDLAGSGSGSIDGEPNATTNGHGNGNGNGNGNATPKDNRKVAIVTGATSGIGLSLAKHLLQTHNYRVALIGRNVSTGTSVASSLNDYHSAQFFQCDVASYASQAEMFSNVWKTWGRIDLCCFNAGIVDQSSVYIYESGEEGRKKRGVEDVPASPDLSATDVCYKGVVYGTQLATHFMRFNPHGKGGRIVVNGSIGGMFPHRAYPEYCGAKAAVIQFVRGVAPLLKRKEAILMNVVLPGIVDTPIVPKEMIEAVSPECLTPMSTVIAAHDVFINDETGQVGKVLEASSDQLVFYEPPEYGNGYKTKRAVTVWEPLFREKHGEDSGLEDAIP